MVLKAHVLYRSRKYVNTICVYIVLYMLVHGFFKALLVFLSKLNFKHLYTVLLHNIYRRNNLKISIKLRPHN